MIKEHKSFNSLFKLDSDLMSRKEAAIYLGVSERTLAIWACTKRYNLPYVKMGRHVKYRKSVLDEFIESRTVYQHD